MLSAIHPLTRAVLFFGACPTGGGAVLYSIPYSDLSDPAAIQDTFGAQHYTCVCWPATCEHVAGALTGWAFELGTCIPWLGAIFG